MTDYQVSIQNRIYKVSIENDQLLVDGQEVAIDLETIDQKGLHILRKPNQNTDTILEAGQSGHYQIQIDGKHLSAQVRSGSTPQNSGQIKKSGNIHSPMPGMVVDILVKIGDRVKKGQTILIQEAMKMQMKLKAPESGIIQSISAIAGERVDKGTLLISLVPGT